MLPLPIQNAFENISLGTASEIQNISGGCINQCFKVKTNTDTYFVKYHTQHSVDYFAAEAHALDLLAQQSEIIIPKPLHFGPLDQSGGFMILEWLDLQSPSQVAQEKLGHGLAQMHLNLTAEQFGLPIDNALGATPQPNTQSSDWVGFYQTQRLAAVLDKVLSKYRDQELEASCNTLIELLPKFFKDLKITPCLLHGDLWGGNFAQNPQQKPAIFDPASYYGHHEAELGMMHLFGGFSNACFSAYHEIIPKEVGFEERNALYQLYHVINHYYLFGKSYRAQALSIIQSLL